MEMEFLRFKMQSVSFITITCFVNFYAILNITLLWI